MKKCHIAVIFFSTMIAALSGFTGCNNKTSDSVPESGFSAPESTVGNSENSDSTDSSESTYESSESVPEQRLSDEKSAIISKLKIQNFVGPDGETVLMTDAADLVRYTGIEDETILLFDFAYMRYARPYFYAGEYFDDDDERDQLPEMKWFKVREGDELDCGLTVKKAEFNLCPVPYWERMTHIQTIELDGDITLEGMLFATTNPNDYASKVGDLNFIVDPTKTEGIPVVRLDHDKNEEWYNLNRFIYTEYDKLYFESDAANMWYIGNINDDGFDERAVFGGDEFVRVRATLKNVKLYVFNEIGGGGIGGCDVTADIVDIERIE